MENEIAMTAMYIKAGWEVYLAKHNGSIDTALLEGNRGNIEFTNRLLDLSAEIDKIYNLESAENTANPSGVYHYDISETLGSKLAEKSIKEVRYISDDEVLEMARELIISFLY
ncbi:hypothetical protein [Dickeya sp. NCPPB 3274]|uniref:hypothetical protein n=1 Tax=Dickeya sp. NCPPB 3274 TaxID=568766 RepID=UPI0005B346D6|nr:hypothetical protein [Dickeya sp. NCPPB 3274]